MIVFYNLIFLIYDLARLFLLHLNQHFVFTMENFHFFSGDLTFFLAVTWSALGFFFYYFFSHSSSWAAKKAEKKGNPELETLYSVLFQRLLGVLFIGLVPLAYIIFVSGEHPSSYGTSAEFLKPLPWWTWVLLAGIILLNWFNAGSAVNLKRYPMIRVKNWSRSLLLLSALSWIAYLLAYEFFFRGVLLYSSLSLLGTWPAIAINIAIYGFAHMYKGAGEAFGAMPLGVVFCLLTLITGNIWGVMLLHGVMALTNEWFALLRQPEMKLTKKW